VAQRQGARLGEHRGGLRGKESLRSEQAYHWRVRTWDDRGVLGGWSAPARWETGLMKGESGVRDDSSGGAAYKVYRAKAGSRRFNA